MPSRGDINLRDTPKVHEKIKHRQDMGKIFFSFEYFPPKTPSGVDNLYDRIDRMSRVEPLFVDVTWGAGGSTSDLTLEISGNIQRYFGLDVCMHLTCTNMPSGKVDDALNAAKERGIRNIVALRGDPPKGEEWHSIEGGFEHAVDLVRHIRKSFGEHFSICVAGYPEGHPAGLLEGNLTYEQELHFLKEKVEAGDFCSLLKTVVVSVLRMTKFCKTHVPDEVLKALQPIKDDDAAVKEFGIRLGIDMCRRILHSGLVPGIHFYTLNLEKAVMSIIEGLDMIPKNQSIRSLPWRPATIDRRRHEDVRPIFWSNRPKSYISRTEGWDEFPNGRWGDNRSPAFGELTEHHLLGSGGFRSKEEKEALHRAYGELKNFSDVSNIFLRYLSGEVSRLLWSESDGLAKETMIIMEPLKWLNKHGLFTINSQPRVNGVPSSDIVFGWGGPGGYVYQKAYIEFFAKREVVEALIEASKSYPLITIFAVSSKDSELLTNTKNLSSANAVTWGVFPDREIIQPTVVDPYSFLVWKEEAFSIWTELWGRLYEKDSTSQQILRHIHDNFMLVNVVDNDYVAGDIFRLFDDVVPKFSLHDTELVANHVS
ncbi:Probable methylenetetrahydrofolate reductase [Galdieria sulphuraria]|nr:Probable methylenetetrahydrofolate reductase [Galdieria sulphuraria]